MNHDDMRKVINFALKELEREVKRLVSDVESGFGGTLPVLPLPSIPTFIITEKPNVSWPYVRDGVTYYNRVGVELGFGDGKRLDDFRLDHPTDVDKIVDVICQSCAYEPARVLMALRNIQKARDWCKEQREALRRQAEELVRQQADAVRELEAELALHVLGQMQ